MGLHSPFQDVEQQSVLYDMGLRRYMMRVYGWMGCALVVTALVAYLVTNTSLFGIFFSMSEDGRLGYSALGLVAAFSPLAFVLVLSFGIRRLSYGAVRALFLLYSALIGVSFSVWLIAYTATSVVQTFFITSLLYLTMSLWGYVTKRSLASFGSFLFMGLIGIVIALVVNMFTQSTMMNFLISCFGVLIFTGFTAYDTQRIKLSYQSYLALYSQEEIGKASIYDALSLYLNFINLFSFILSLTGTRSNSN